MPCESQQRIDEALKVYLKLASMFSGAASRDCWPPIDLGSADSNLIDRYLPTDYEWAKCAWLLLEAPLFRKHKSYVRRRMIGRLRKVSLVPVLVYHHHH